MQRYVDWLKLAASSVMGLLWVADLMANSGVDRELLARGLETLLAHPKCRLPREVTLAQIARLRP